MRTTLFGYITAVCTASSSSDSQLVQGGVEFNQPENASTGDAVENTTPVEHDHISNLLFGSDSRAEDTLQTESDDLSKLLFGPASTSVGHSIDPISDHTTFAEASDDWWAGTNKGAASSTPSSLENRQESAENTSQTESDEYSRLLFGEPTFEEQENAIEKYINISREDNLRNSGASRREGHHYNNLGYPRRVGGLTQDTEE
jgi:hypothetical protein